MALFRTAPSALDGRPLLSLNSGAPVLAACASSEMRTVTSIEPEGSTSCPLCATPPKLHREVSSRDRYGNPLRSVLCQRCGLVFASPMPSEERLARFYEAEYRRNYKKSVAPRRRHILRAFRLAAERFESLRPHIPETGKAIDIGSGGGEWVCLLGRLGYEAAGIEPSEGYAEFARREYGAGITIAPLSTVSLSAPYELITAFHVLEHLRDPADALRRFAAALSAQPTSRVVIEVPNIATVLQATRSKFHFAHVVGFTPASLEAMASRAGLALVADLSGEETALNVRMVFARGEADPNALPSAQSIARTEDILRRPNAVHNRTLWNLGTKAFRAFEERIATAGRSASDIADRVAAKAATNRRSN